MTFAAPVLKKTWDTVLNITVAGNATLVGETSIDRRELLFKIKDTLVSGGLTIPWTVPQSSNGTTADGTDNWTTVADLVFTQDSTDPNTTVRSWIVLSNSVMGLHLLIDCTQGGTSRRGSELDVWLSETAYAIDGTTSTLPTNAGTQHQLLDRTDTAMSKWGAGTANSFARTYVVNFWQSTDGKHLRVIATNPVDGQNLFWIFGTLENAEGPPSHLWYAQMSLFATIGDQEATQIANLNEGALDTILMANESDATVRARILAPRLLDTAGWDAFSANNRAYDGVVVFSEIGIYCHDVTFRAQWDVIPDMWWGPTDQHYEAKPWPGSTRTFCQFRDIVLPWDGSVPIQVT